MSRQVNHIYEFGEFRLETAERLLLRQGKPVSLTPKAFETLLVLVGSGGHVVEKGELMKRVWPDAFVEEANLARNVWALRKALGDVDGEHAYIETVPKLGYCFVAPVAELADEDADVLIQRRIRARIVNEEEETSEEPTRRAEVETPPAQVVETTRPATALSLALLANRKRRNALLGLSAAALLVALAVARFVIRDSRSGSAARPIESVAVMPFANLSNDPELDYLSEGLTENLINRLSHVSRLKVIAHNSVFRYRGKQIDAQKVGGELGVQAVLLGRLEVRGDKLLIDGELVGARDGTHVWGERYERGISDLQSLQADLAQDMAAALRLEFSGEEKARLAEAYVRNPEAYQLYLKGRYFWNRRTPEDLQRAADYFQQAIAKDPSYALAYSGLADAYFYMGYAFGRTPPGEAMPKAKAAALKALELDESLAEAHASLGLVKFVYD